MTGSNDHDVLVREIFLAAIDVPEESRVDLVVDRCGENQAVRDEVESLLAHHDRPIGFVKTLNPAFGPDDESFLSARTDDLDPIDEVPLTPGRRIDRYELTSRIAAGGMGIVYRAEQDSPHRTVALKVLRPGLTTGRMLRRFEYEAEVLGLLRHPGIARIHEAGTAETEEGTQPFFAMELVDGPPITRYAKEHALPIAERVELLIKVCDAVHHAHQKGIVHRDLKPSNVLVETTGDGSGQPKVLDFGVARATDADLRSASMQTETGRLVGTVPYMSPEQAGGNPDDIDTRSDVYALGVLAFEVLSGTMPYDLSDLMLHDAVRVIREQEPTRLGTINDAFRGDLETIVGKALEKDKDRRYDSAASLGEDLRRYLAFEPIEARPASAIYQLSKFARRHRPLLAGAAVALIAIIAGLVGTTVNTMRADAQKQQAERVTEFFEAIFESGAIDDRGREVTLKEVMDDASDRIIEDLADEPAARGRLQTTIGSTYLSLGDPKNAETLLLDAVDTLTDELGDDHQLTLKARGALALVYHTHDAYDKALELYEPALRLQRKTLGTHHADTIEMMGNLAVLFKNLRRYDESAALREEAIEVSTKVHGADHRTTLTLRQNRASLNLALAGIHKADKALETKHHDAAERELKSVMKRAAELFGPADALVLVCRNTLGIQYRRQQRYAECEAILLGGVNGCLETFGADHHKTKRFQATLVRFYYTRGRFNDAIALAERMAPGADRGNFEAGVDVVRSFRRTERDAQAIAVGMPLLQQWQERHDGSDADMRRLLTELALAYRDSDLAHAEPIHQQLYDACLVNGESHWSTVYAMHNLGNLYRLQERFADAEPLLADAVERASAPKEPHGRLDLYTLRHGLCLAALESENAADVLQTAYALLVAKRGDDHEWTVAAREALAELTE